MAELDARRTEVLGRSASIIQRKVRSYMARRSFTLLRKSAIQMQSICRGAYTFSIDALVFVWTLALVVIHLVGLQEKLFDEFSRACDERLLV